MKVISGSLKGRNIEGFTIDGTRPTMDRVKESLFASIQDYIEDSVVLDLFAGSGNLAIEAISNGSRVAYFNDVSKSAVKVIKNNIEKFNIEDRSVVLNLDYQKCLKTLSQENKCFDIIFLDPPYAKAVLNEVINFILENNLLRDNGLIVCEVSSDYLNDFRDLKRIKEKKYGDKYVVIYQKTL